MITPSQEDYLEAIWQITQQKGYARVSDIAEHLGISAASVSKMVRKLHQAGEVSYERYRGFTLTEEGKLRGRRFFERHQTLARFYRAFGFNDPEVLHRLVEGIEHYFDAASLDRVQAFLTFLEEHDDVRALWDAWSRSHRGDDGASDPY